MIFVVSLPALLANVRYKWLANGSLGSEESTGITQVGTFLAFRISSTPPANAEELFIYDSTDESNYAVARFAHLPSESGGGIDVDAIADAVWDEALSGHQTAGTAGDTLSSAGSAGDPWGTLLPGSYSIGTAGAIVGAINPPNVTIVSPVSQTGNKITVRAGDSWILPVAGLGDISTRTKLWFSVNAPGEADTDANLFIEESAGLTVLNGAENETTTNGSIIVVDDTTGSISISVEEAATALLSGTTHWAIKILKADGTAVTLSTGKFVVTKPGIEAIT